jgi:hypothetical protein
MKLEFSQHIFEKYSNSKLNENPSSGRAELFHTDGRDETDCRFSQFWDGA